MFTYTTCRDCGNILHVTNGDTHHPDCTPKPRPLELLYHEWTLAIAAGDPKAEAALKAEIDKHEAQPPRLLDAALAYAAWGWPVFPLKPGTKKPVTEHGFKDAVTTPEQIRDWWAGGSGNFNIGLPTGIHFDVVDVDHLPAYYKLLTLSDPTTGDGPLPHCHGRVHTANGGLHLYVKRQGLGTKAGVAPGIDVRGEGGYVVAPPSVTETGRWRWVTHPSPAIKAAAC